MRSETRPTATRLAALDGLRGVACLVVLVHHCLLSVPAFANAYYHGADSRATQSLGEYLLTWSPLHLVWEGTGAVWTFFVLSGFVLTRHALSGARFSWRAYYPQRVIRLYVPVAAAVVLAAVLVTVFGGADHGAAGSEWIARRADRMHVRGILHDLTLVLGAGSGISPLWSLQWEVWFSLLLPLFVFAVRARGGATAWLAAAMAPVAAGVVLVLGGGAYLAVFLVGAVLAGVHERDGAARPVAVRTRAASVLTAVAVLWVVVLLPARWTLWAWRLPGVVTMALSVSAALVVVLLALHWRRAQRWLTGRTVLWAGAVSFSLYLVHEPIVVASVKALGDRMLWLALPLAVVVALTTAELFRRGVETPAGTLARQIGRGVGSWHPMRRRREAAQVRSMLQDIRSGLRRAAVVRHADPEAPVRSALPVLGVGASAARRIARRAVRTRDVVEPHLVVPAARRLWDDAAAREERYAAMELLALPGVDGDPRVLPAVEHMARTGRWRDYADALARRLPRLLENDADRTGELLRGWSTDDDVWMRRMAITAQVGRGERTDRGLLVDVIAPNRSHPDVFVRTAVGAALRDLARADPDWVRAYVEDHGLDPITRSAAPTPAEVDEPTARGVPSLAVPA